MAFNDTYRESIQSKHIANVGFTSTAKGVTNEGNALANPHQVLASQIPAMDVVGTYGALTADGISAGVVEQHTVKLTADPTVNNNLAWFATEDNCTEAGHAARGAVRLTQWMRYAETQYKLRIFEDNGAGTAPNMSAEILPSEVAFNWEYDASAGLVYFDADPNSNGKTVPLWGILFTYIGDTVESGLAATTSGLGSHTHVEADITNLDKYTQTEVDSLITTTSGDLQDAIAAMGESHDEFTELTDTISSYTDGRILFESDSAVIDDVALTYASGTQTLFTPNISIQTDASVGGDVTIDGNLGFDAGTTVNEFVTTVDGSSTDDQAPTAGAVYDIVSTTSGTLQTSLDDLDSALTDDIIWEVVDTPFEQIRPKTAHQGKAVYTAGNLTIGGDLTVSGTTTTINSEELTVTDKIITVNNGEAGAGITGSQYAGIEVDRGSEADYFFAFDEVQDNFRVGISGSLQAVATREDAPMDGYIAVWNDSAVRFDTDGGLALSDIATEAFVTTVSGHLQGEIDSLSSDLTNNYYTITELDSGQLDNRYYTETEIDAINTALSGTLQTQIDTNATDITNNYNTLDTKIDTTSGTLQTAIDDLANASDEFLELTDTMSAFTENRILFESTNAVVDDVALTYVSGTQTLNVTNIDATGNVNIDGIFGFDTGTTVNEFVTTVDNTSTDDQVPTAGAVFNIVNTTSGVLQTAIDNNATDITNNYNTLDSKIDTTSGTLQQAINDLADASDEFLELTDTMSAYNESRLLFESADAVIDDAALTYVSGTQTLNAPNVAITTDLTVGGDATIDGNLGFDAGTTINEFVTLIDAASTDNQAPTAAGVYTLVSTASGTLQTQITDNYNTLDTKIDTTSGTLQDEIGNLDSSLTDAIVWEVVDTPFEQIRPKAAHQGKAVYTAGNLTIGGDLTVSGTTTTINSEELTVTDKIITVNNGEAGAGITGNQYAGIEVDRGSEADYMFVFDEVQDNFRVGISGSLQAVATREDNPLDTRVPYWNDSSVRFDTLGNTYQTIVTTSGSGEIDITTDLTSVINLTDSTQRFGVISDTSLVLDQTGNRVQSTVAGNEWLDVGATITDIFASTATQTEAGRVRLTGGTISLWGGTGSADVTQQVLISDAGMQLSSGADVNEISTVLSAASTDDQLVTAKTVYDEIVTISGTISSLDHNTDLSSVQGGTTNEYYHLTNNEYQAFSSDGSTWTFSQAMALNTGTSVNEISTTVDGSSTDDQLATAKAIYDYVEAKPTTFLGLTDTFSSFTDQRILYTNASGVVDNSSFTFDDSTGTLTTNYIDLENGGSVNEIVTTITSGTTNSMLPTAKAVWDLTEAAAAAVHIHYDNDASYVSDTEWTYDTGVNPEGIEIYVNGVKQRIGSTYDCTIDVTTGVITITFTYNVISSNWVNVTYYA